MHAGGKTQEEMKKVGRNRAKLQNQFGSDKVERKAHGGKVHSDEAEDRKMVRGMVKPGALK
jgi:hypothetical protein